MEGVEVNNVSLLHNKSYKIKKNVCMCVHTGRVSCVQNSYKEWDKNRGF